MIAIVGGIAKYKGMPVTVMGISAEKIRKKIFAVTEKFNRPIICFIDTKGAYPGSD